MTLEFPLFSESNQQLHFKKFNRNAKAFTLVEIWSNVKAKNLANKLQCCMLYITLLFAVFIETKEWHNFTECMFWGRMFTVFCSDWFDNLLLN